MHTPSPFPRPPVAPSSWRDGDTGVTGSCAHAGGCRGVLVRTTSPGAASLCCSDLLPAAPDPSHCRCLSPAGRLPSDVPEVQLPGPGSGFGACHCSRLPLPRWAFVTVPVSPSVVSQGPSVSATLPATRTFPVLSRFSVPRLCVGGLADGGETAPSGLADSRTQAAAAGARVFQGTEAPHPSLTGRTHGGGGRPELTG